MENYIERSMVKDEFVQVKAKCHWFVWIGFCFKFLIFGGIALFCAYAASKFYFADMPLRALIFLFLAVALFLYIFVAFLRLKMTEMACTNRRVVYKTGIIAIKTEEIMLDKIESIQIEQTIFGRIFGCGNVSFSGTGTFRVDFYDVSNPWKVKTRIEELMEEVGKKIKK